MFCLYTVKSNFSKKKRTISKAIIQNSEILKTKFSVNERIQIKYKDCCFSLRCTFISGSFKLKDYMAKRGGKTSS